MKTNKKVVGLIILIVVLIMFGVMLFLSLFNYFSEVNNRNEVINEIVIRKEVVHSSFDYKDYLIRRAESVNENYVKNNSELSKKDTANKEQIEERVNAIFKYVDKYMNGREDYIIDIYSIIEHETKWVNFYSLDSGRSFGVPSIQFTTIREVLGEDYSQSELRDNTYLQIEGAVLYYKCMYEHFGSRNMAIIAYNRGFNINSLPHEYTYWQKVNQIKEEINRDIGGDNH